MIKKSFALPAFLGTIFSLIRVTVLPVILSPSGYGVISIISLIKNNQEILKLGGLDYIVRELRTEPSINRQDYLIQLAFNFINTIVLFLTVIAIILLLIYRPNLIRSLLAILLFFTLILSLYQGVYKMFREFREIHLRIYWTGFVESAIITFLGILFVSKFGELGYYSANLLSVLFGSVLLYTKIAINGRMRLIKSQELFMLFHRGKTYLIGSFSQKIFRFSDRFIVLTFLGTELFGVFAFALSGLDMVKNLISWQINKNTPMLYSFSGSQNDYSFLRRMSLGLFISGVLIFVLIMPTSGFFVRKFYPEYSLAAPIFGWLLIGLITLLMSQPYAIILGNSIHKLQKEINLIYLAFGVLNFMVIVISLIWKESIVLISQITMSISIIASFEILRLFTAKAGVKMLRVFLSRILFVIFAIIATLVTYGI